MRILFSLSLAVALVGCGTNSAVMKTSLEKGEIAARIQKSPIVERLSSENFPVQRNPGEIELHYRSFHLLNSPDAIINWQYYYVLGEASSPAWDYEAVADITVYQYARDDKTALGVIRNKASEIGGAGVIDMFRKPISAPGTTTHAHGRTSTPIEAYLYYGRIVRQKVR